MPRPGRCSLALALALTLSLAGCGLVPATPRGPAKLTVTRDFGAQSVLARNIPLSRTTRTAEQVLRAGQPQAAAPPHGTRWFLYVNGIGVLTDPEKTVIHPGDRVWWDLHPTAAGAQVRAVVGAYPDPFVHGVGGKRLPATLECAPDVTLACTRVAAALSAIGVPSVRQVLGTGSGSDTLGVVVGTARELRAEVVAVLVNYGPTASGVFGRFTGAGLDSLQLLGRGGRPARSLGPGAGLLAATGDIASEPTWLVTGTDPLGVAAAAAELTPAVLRNHFALAVQGPQTFALPLQSR